MLAIIDGKEDAFACRKPSADTLCSPEQLAIDSSGNLWVADYINSRVLLIKDPIDASNTSERQTHRIVPVNAQLVIGQGPSGTQFSSRTCDNGDATNPIPSADTLCDPDGVAVDGNGNVYVSDSGNGRLLEYKNPLSGRLVRLGFREVRATSRRISRSMPAAASPSENCGVTADQLCSPYQLAVDSQNNLYAVDLNRVLEYLNPTAPGGGTPGTPGSPGDTTADVVYGQQGSFTADSCNGNDISSIVNGATLCQPTGVAVDLGGDVYIADSANHRLLAFTHQGN